MDLRTLTKDFSVSPQIAVDDLHAIAGAGFRSVLCNRPDGEEYGQPGFEAIAAAAEAEGLQTRHVPMGQAGVSPQIMAEFRAALDEMPGPVLAYCRSGTRCTVLWSIAQHGTLDDAEIVRRAQEAGYDMAGLVRQLGGG